ncbi:MAG: hypothetical protein JNJ41_00510 [Bacteroidia bacterium]|nr:hypothetical protein [Bacteroidia bacterium]
MNKLWNKIWFNLLIDIVMILTLLILGALNFYNVVNGEQSETLNLTDKLFIGFDVFLALHAVFILIISIINLWHKNLLKGIVYFLQFAFLLVLIWFGSWFYLLPRIGGMYIDEASVNANVKK